MCLPATTGNEDDRRSNRRQEQTYTSWRAMRDRCSQPHHKSWAWYGGRGITVCVRWGDYRAFLDDMGERPDGSVIDRVDPQSGYWCGRKDCSDCGPAGRRPNCRWVGRKASNWNKSDTVVVRMPDGPGVPLSMLADLAGVGRATARERYRRGWELWRVLKPIGERNEK